MLHPGLVIESNRETWSCPRELPAYRDGDHTLLPRTWVRLPLCLVPGDQERALCGADIGRRLKAVWRK